MSCCEHCCTYEEDHAYVVSGYHHDHFMDTLAIKFPCMELLHPGLRREHEKPRQLLSIPAPEWLDLHESIQFSLWKMGQRLKADMARDLRKEPFWHAILQSKST